MKKVLLATTAVALSAGVAMADVSLSGDARMGLRYDSISGDTKIEKRMTVNIDASKETDSGITFGARLRLRSDEGKSGVANGARVYLKTGGLELAMGNINGAIESMPGLYAPTVGLTGLSFAGLVANTTVNSFAWDSYSSNKNGPEGVEVIYTAGAFTGHLSYSDNTAGGISTNPGVPAARRTAAYVAYTLNDWTFALGGQESDVVGEDKVILTVGGNIGDYGVGFGFADNEGVQKIALNGSAKFGATKVSAFIADEDTAGADTLYGLGVSYDLGGASVVAGFEHDALGDDRADFGVSFKF